MPLTADIVESWRRPRVVVRRLMVRGASEPLVFSFLLAFLALALAAVAPGLARQAWLEGGTPLLPRLYASGLGLLATIPLWYLLAALGHLAARAFGGKGSYQGGRLALFWSLLVTAPAMLVQGLVLGMVGAGLATSLLGVAVGMGFLIFWGLALRAVES